MFLVQLVLLCVYFQGFVDVCLKNHNRHEAVKYLPRVAADKKVKYYIKAG